MKNPIVTCPQCGSMYELTPDGPTSVPVPEMRKIYCEMCQGLVYEYECTTTTYGARLIQSHPAKLTLPLWVVLPRRAESPAVRDPCGEPSHVIVFSESARALDYMKSRQSGAWKLDHVLTESQLRVIVADLRHHQVGAICLDPKPDGSGGTKVELTEMI